MRQALKHLATREEERALDGSTSDETIGDIVNAVEEGPILKVVRLFRQIRREPPLPRAG